jgi:hypothetical protein
MDISILLIIFFMFLIINHMFMNNLFPFIETIEAMTCNPNKQSVKSVCFNKKMEENKKLVKTIEYTTSKLVKKISDLIGISKKNTTNSKKTEKNIRNIKNTNEGRGIDNSEACAKHPEAC